MHSELSELKPFVPVLNAMKEDTGLVDHVRTYLENGGAPSQSVTERLGLDEDFIYNSDEALQNPESDSAKVFEHSVDKIVNAKVDGLLQQQKAEAEQRVAGQARKVEEVEFKKANNMTDEDFASMMNKANSHVMTLEDLHLLVNKDKVTANTATATKKDMLKQMKNVRNIPISASSANSAEAGEKSLDDEIFDALHGTDGDIDNLFE